VVRWAFGGVFCGGGTHLPAQGSQARRDAWLVVGGNVKLQVGQGVEVVQLSPVLSFPCQLGEGRQAKDGVRTRLQRRAAWRRRETSGWIEGRNGEWGCYVRIRVAPCMAHSAWCM